jgi:N-acetylmuramoyl-L-alanine amidase
MSFEIRDNFLFLDGEQVEYRPSPNHGGEITPRLIVIHYTGDNSCQGAVSWLTSPQSGVSAHLVVDKDGTVYQLLPFNVVGWHARGHYNGQSVNGCSVGIENVGLGGFWPDEQIEANRGVIEALYAAYPIDDTIGHGDISDRTPGHDDPGPNFPWDRVTT